MRHLSKNRSTILRPVNISSASNGQSFVELSLVVLLLMLLVAGIAEYGVLLNRYLNILDAAREAARYNSNLNPICPATSTDPNCPAGQVSPDYYKVTACLVVQTLSPLRLDAAAGDDIVISFFRVTETGGVSTITGREPTADGESGWSWAENGDTVALGTADEKPCQSPGSIGAGVGHRNKDSNQNTSFVQGRMDTSAPEVSVSLVEIFYNYPQTLRLPVFQQFIPDPIPVYSYAIMPIKNIGP